MKVEHVKHTNTMKLIKVALNLLEFGEKSSEIKELMKELVK